MQAKEKPLNFKQFSTLHNLYHQNDSPPLLLRSQNEYPLHQDHFDSRQTLKNKTNKENANEMINSVPVNKLHPPRNIIKIDNYEGRRFKTQMGFNAPLASSRYEGVQREK